MTRTAGGRDGLEEKKAGITAAKSEDDPELHTRHTRVYAGHCERPEAM